MSGVIKGVSGMAGKLSPLIGMIPGGGMINAGLAGINGMFGQGGGGYNVNDPSQNMFANSSNSSGGGGGINWGMLGQLGLGAA